MKLRACLTAVSLVAGVAAGAPVVAGVTVVQVPSTTLVRGASYAWGPISGVVAGTPAPAIVNEITAEQLEKETVSVLSSKGYRLIEDPSEADLIITYTVLLETGVDANLTAQNTGCGPFCLRGTDYNLLSHKKTQGTLVLDLYDRRTGRLVYRATSEKEVSSKDASAKHLNAVLRQMTKSLPS